jgi:selenocysteine-specific elongation factor
MYVVATAGHVDHGKSTLVRALTDREPDRLAEERRRGLSIELGYAWTALPGAGDVAFVDVPGHQRFITTALAGMGPVPVVMFVVAADDPWMPQAEEHLAALAALGVRRGLLVVTRSDLADPAPALQRAQERLGAVLGPLPAVTISGRTGAGLDDLRAVLADVLAAVPPPDPRAAVRLWVDRRFHVRGAGTVVTGTLPAGTIAVGDRLEVAGEPVRVRGIESLEVPRDHVTGVARVALDLGGRAPDGIGRGVALTTPGAYPVVEELDVRLDGSTPERPVLHVGSAAVEARVRPLDGPYARLRLATPLPLADGDRVVLRDPGSRTVWGADVLDVAPPPLVRRGAAKQRARVLAGEVAPATEHPEATTPDEGPTDHDRALAAKVDQHLDENPFAAPTADELQQLGLDDGDAVRLHKAGLLVRIAPGIVLGTGVEHEAIGRLEQLDEPFTTSQARTALTTSRRVALALLQHLDKHGVTVRLADDTRRLRRADAARSASR